MACCLIFSSSVEAQRRKGAAKQTIVKTTTRSSLKSSDAAVSLTVTLSAIDLKSIGSYSVEEDHPHLTMDIYNFGDGLKTVMFDLKYPKLLEGMNKLKQVYSWSGHITITPANKIMKEIQDGYVITRNGTNCGALVKCHGKWDMIVWSDDECKTVSDLYSDMALVELSEKMKDELTGSQFIETGKNGNGKVYTLYWLDMSKEYEITGDYHYNATNDKVYGTFYFDSQDKLRKWVFYY
jgi:hypothetical protein